MKKRFLSMLLTLCLLLGLLPTAVLAAEEHSGHGEGWTAVTNETTALTDGSYYLSEGGISGDGLTVTGTATLCLNGQTLNRYIEVQRGGSLTICDCSESDSGKISGSFYSYVIQNYGTLVLERGAVENTDDGYGIYNRSGSLTITGGSVCASGSEAIYNYGALTITGGTVTTSSAYDYAIYHSSSSDLILGGSPTITTSGGSYGDICLGSAYGGSVDAGGPTEGSSPYAGGNLTVEASDSYPNGVTAVKQVTADNKDKFSCSNSRYRFRHDESAGSLIFCGEPVALTWNSPDNQTLSGDAYPATAEYGATLDALPEYTEENMVFLGWANSYGELLTTSTRITGAMTFTAQVVPLLPGSGTAESPYELDSPEDLVTLRKIVASGNTAYNSSSVFYKLTADIDLSFVCGEETGSWMPIGDYSRPFKANFDGGGKTISNLYISSTSDYQGLFGRVYGTYSGYAVIKDLTLSGSVTGDESVGLLAGYAGYARITGCTVTGSVAGSDDFGPLVGEMGSDVTLEGNNTSGVTAVPAGYTTDGNGIMAYRQDSYYNTTYDIMGFYNGSWIKTTYDNDGYAVATSGLSGATVSVEPRFLNDGQYIQMNYTVTAGSGGVSGGKLAVHTDVQIGDNDRAAIETITDRNGKAIGLRMVDTHTSTSCSSKDAQFNLYFGGTGGVTPVDTYWFGQYGARDDSLTVDGQSTYRYFLQLDETSAYASGGTYAADYSSYSDGDSGLAFSWQDISLAAGESETFSVVVGVGTKADPPVWGDYTTDGGEKRPVVTLAVDQVETAFQVKARVQDASGLTDTLYYSVETGSGVYNGMDNVALASAEATGSMQELAGQISTAGYPAGEYTFSFWVGNSAGALSDAVAKTLTIGEGGTVTGGLDTAAEPEEPAHTHSWTYTASGAVITAVCGGGGGCDVTATTLTISAPAHTTVGDDRSAEATLSGTSLGGVTILPAIAYYSGEGASGDPLGSAPTAAGTYTAAITVGGATAAVTYTITDNSVTVTYDGNGATSGVPAPQSSNGPGYFTIASPEGMVREGYTFLKWNKENKYPDGDPYKVGHSTWIQSSVTLYAIWGKNVLEATAPDGTVTMYPTLQMAFERAPNGSTIRVLEDYDDLEGIGVVYVDIDDPADDRSLTLDLNGSTVTGHIIIGNGSLTMMDSAGGGALNGMIQQQGGGLTVNGGTFLGLLSYAYSLGEGTTPSRLQLNGGTFRGGDLLGAGDGSNYGIAVIGTTAEEAAAAFQGAIPEGKRLSRDMGAGTMGTEETYHLAYAQGPVTVLDDEKFVISGSVTEGMDPVSDVTVTLKQGRKTIATATTGANGSYQFTNVPAGVYNIVATKDGRTVTILVTVTDGDLSNADLTLHVGRKNSVVEISGADTPNVVVGGLDTIAGSDSTGNSIEIKMTVTAREDVTGSGDAEHESLKTEQMAIKAQAPGKTLAFLDLTLTKTVDTTTTDIGGSNTQLLTIVIPFEKGNKQDVTVYRYHDAGAEALKEGSTNAVNGEYFTVSESAVTVYTKKFSTYAIGYTVPGGSGTGGGGGSIGYPPIVKDADHGSVRVSPNSPTSGSKVTITPEADEGYAVDQVTVVDHNGKPVEVTAGPDGTWSFRQPVGQVTVTVTFKPVVTASDCPRDGACPLARFTDAVLDAWYHDGIHYCVEQGLMAGTGGTAFAPNQDTSRAMIATILWRLEGSPAVDSLMMFGDVPQGQWYSEAVCWAAGEGVAAGYGNGKFGPNDAITREQLCTMLWRYAGRPETEPSLSGYTDADSVSDYARQAVAWAVERGVVTGATSTTLAPRGMATRAQAAAMLMRFCKAAAR